ncbi:MAG: hypothetical protein HKO93_04765, partial [Flavobacteriales bacterium]|nr:hypothetical protein [Flavobacteriales bacterium]
AGDWALNISKAMGATTYINPADGEELFKQEDFNKAQIELSFHKPVIHAYKQRNEKFIPGLSILDVLLFSDFSFSERRMQPRLESI